MRPRILHIITELDWGSATRQLLAIARRNSGAFEFHVAARSAPATAQTWARDLAIEVHTAPDSRWWGQSMDLAWLLGVVRRLQPQVVHLWRWPECWEAAPLVKCMSTAAVVADLRLAKPIRSDLRHLAQPLSHRFVDVTVQHVDWYPRRRHDVPGPDRPVCIVDECPGLEAAGHKGAEVMGWSDVRQALRLGSEAKLILAAGRLARRKRLRDAIWAADLLKVVRDDVHLLIAGEGPDQARLWHYRDLVRIPDRVHFLGPVWDLATLARQCDLAWCASELEDDPRFFRECSAWGLPIAASRIRAHLGFSKATDRTRFFPVGDRASLARQTIALLKGRSERAGPPVAGPDLAAGEGPAAVADAAPCGSYATLYQAFLKS